MFNEVFKIWRYDNVEQQLASSDHGHDLASCTQLLARHDLLKADIGNHQPQMFECEQQAKQFVADKHFAAESLSQRCAKIVERYIV
jgi:hypothetical protein